MATEHAHHRKKPSAGVSFLFLSACSFYKQDYQLVYFLKAWSGQVNLMFTDQEK